METEFHEGDRVFYPYYGMGTVVADYKTSVPYPIKVVWDKPLFKEEPYSHFSRDGTMSIPLPISNADELKLVLANSVPNEETGGSEMGQIASVTNHEIVQKEREKMQDEGRKFKVGDHVFSRHYGFGVIETISDEVGVPYPVIVHWEQDKNRATCPNMRNSYTSDGEFYADGSEPERDIILHDILLTDEEEDDESTVERMEEGLNKKVKDAINPSHYKVKGLPEAIDIINHLMHRCQLEGFFWGNILKYAYRYGRKGDKAETAGKIEWYARQLKELCECEAEKEEGDKK